MSVGELKKTDFPDLYKNPDSIARSDECDRWKQEEAKAFPVSKTKIMNSRNRCKIT